MERANVLYDSTTNFVCLAHVPQIHRRAWFPSRGVVQDPPAQQETDRWHCGRSALRCAGDRRRRASHGRRGLIRCHSRPARRQTPLEEARDLYKKGKAQYETFDYAGAIETWTAAYALVPEDSLQVKIEISYNLASAHEQAYALDGDRQHLQQAKLLLETYAETYALMDVELTERDAAIARANQRSRTSTRSSPTRPRRPIPSPPAPWVPRRFSRKPHPAREATQRREATDR